MDEQLGAVLDLAGREVYEKLNLNIGGNIRQSVISNIINSKKSMIESNAMKKKRSQLGTRSGNYKDNYADQEYGDGGDGSGKFDQVQLIQGEEEQALDVDEIDIAR